MRFFTSRKPALLNFSLLLLFLAAWLFSYMLPAIRGFLEEEHLFYGTVSHAASLSVFGGSNIPFFDKTLFQINGDENATFVLYASQEMLDDMSEWFSFASRDAGDIPLEIAASRISENKFIVHSISSSDGELDFQAIVMEYQVYYAFIGSAIVLVLGIAAFVLFLMWLVKTRK